MTRRRKIILIVTSVVVIALISIWQVRRNANNQTYRTVTASRGTIVQEVSFTGQISPTRTAKVGFAAGGLVQAIDVKEGDVVQQGDLLAQIDPRTASLDAAKSQADLASAQEQAKISADKAATDYEKIKKENAQSIDAQRQKVIDAKAELDQAQKVWEATKDEYDQDSSTARSAYAGYLAKLSVYNTAQEALTTLRQTVSKSNASAKSASDLASAQYAATVQTSGSVAGISSLGALAQRSEVQLSLYSIRAPFTGTITSVTTEVGEYATPGTSAITIATVQNLEIKADVTENDATKLEVGMDSSVTFDALPDQTWAAHVVSINPAATVIEGVPTYETTLQLDTTTSNLRAGLTANIDVHARKKDDVITIPRRAITEQGGKQYVQIIGTDGFQATREVHTGLVGSNGSIEITSGLGEGEAIVLSEYTQ